MEQQTIMLVDDAKINRDMLKEILGSRYRYVEAANGREAVRLLEDFPDN